MKKSELRQLIREELKNIQSESSSSKNKIMKWIHTFNNASVQGVDDGMIVFIASNFAAKGIKAVLDKYNIALKKLGAVRYGIKLSDVNNFSWNESVDISKKSTSLTESKFRAEVAGKGENVWSSNAMEYSTEKEAQQWLNKLSSRWFGYDLSRVVSTSVPKNQKIDLNKDKIYQNFRR